jgi:hypothetical protein
LSNWKKEEWDDGVTIGNYKSLNEIITNEEDQIPVMSTFLKDGIDRLAELKKNNPEIFK